MKRLGFVCLAFLLAAACDDDSPTSPTNPNIVILVAELSAANEVPAITNAESSARGNVRVTLDLVRDGSGTVTGGVAHFLVNLSNFPSSSTSAVAAHIHEGPAGVAGGVRIGIPSTMLSATNPIGIANGGASNVIFNNVELNTATILTAVNGMLANPANFYFNVHTPLNPGGAVRGQLARE